MDLKIKSALISVYYKDGLDSLAKTLHKNGVTIYSTGGTQKFLELVEGDRFTDGDGRSADGRLLRGGESGIAQGFARSSLHRGCGRNVW